MHLRPAVDYGSMFLCYDLSTRSLYISFHCTVGELVAETLVGGGGVEKDGTVAETVDSSAGVAAE